MPHRLPSADLDGDACHRLRRHGHGRQRCTTLRRLFVHESVYDQLVPRLKKAYQSVSVGNPLETSALVGPLIDKAAFDNMQKALREAEAHGGKVTGGGRVEDGHKDAYYVHPALVEMPRQVSPVTEETFAPILYVMKYSDFNAVLDEHNAVGAGLSSSIFTRDLQESERFLSADGSDCGIANVNIGNSGAEIGGAFAARRNRRRPRVRLGCVEGLYAPRHQHHQLLEGTAAGAGRVVRHRIRLSSRIEKKGAASKPRLFSLSPERRRHPASAMISRNASPNRRTSSSVL